MRYGQFMTPMEEAAQSSPSQDQTTRFGFDQSIRKLGYTIKARPHLGEPIWEKKGLPGVEFTHSEVLQRESLLQQMINNTHGEVPQRRIDFDGLDPDEAEDVYS